MYVLNTTGDYDNTTFTNCTEKNDVITPTILLTVSCGLSFLCLMGSMIYTLIKPLKV